ncbi:hypothetical protein ACUXCC_002606 [Cytobacillus horneckiae]|nr:SAR2788 family putative toxin [Cytobacillus horneckiae]MBN6887497.1 hypothetical protein [Cytobacillus horneckiae]
MKFPSYLSKILVFCLLVSVIPGNITSVNAQTNDTLGEDIFIETQIDTNALANLETDELNEDLSTELGKDYIFTEGSNLNINVNDSDNEKLVIETNLSSNEMTAKVDVGINLETSEIIIESSYEENDKNQFNKFNVNILESEGEEFIALFTNIDTGETYEVNSNELQASAVPYLVYVLGGAVVKYAIKKVGGKAALQIGKKVFYKKASSAAKSAAKNFTNVTTSVGGGKNVYFTKSKMEHILKNHHPKYWTGSSNKSFFDSDLSVSSVKSIVTNVINSNKTKIKDALKAGKSVDVVKTINGVKYKVNIGKDGYVKTAYPVPK